MAERPNIVFFFTDDQRFDTIRALGNPQIHTPTLDALVERGTTFTHAHIMGGSSAAVCMPSRAMLMTGRDLFGIQGQGQEVPAGHALMGETLQQAGYRTFGTGKWHNGKAAYARSFTDGDEIFFGGMDDHWNVPAYRFDPSKRYDATFPRCVAPFKSRETRTIQGDHIEAGKHSSELFCEAAARFIDGYERDEPFFLYVSFMAPHDPRTMPQEYRDLYDPETIELPPNAMGAHPFDNGELKIRDEMLEDWPRLPEKIREHIAEYYAMITHADAQMQVVLDALERAGKLDETLIVFGGDNGLAVGRHGLMGKQNLYDHSVRVPLIFSGPGIPEGQRRDQLCYLHDIYPTLCELLELEVPPGVQSRSLAPAIRDAKASHREVLYFAYRHLQRGLREGKWKYIEYHVEGRRRRQLFDLEADPHEMRDLADDPAHAETVKRLGARLREQAEAVEDTREEGIRFYGEEG
jgi:arylsulfatase A-like enzyme